MRFGFALVLMLVSLGSTVHAADLKTRDGRPIQTVAVISRLGDHAVLYHAVTSIPIGTFRPDIRPVLIPDFRIDERIERTIGSAIAPLGVVALAEGVADLNPAAWDRRSAGEKILVLPPREDIDAYIVVCRDKTMDEVGKTMLTVGGLGLYHRWRLFGYITAVFAVYRVMLIDARTGEVISGRLAGIDSGLLESSIPKIEVSDARWPGEGMELSPDQVLLLRDDLIKLMDESVLWTLRKMKLAR